MADNLFDLDVQVNKSQGSVEPQLTSVARCSGGCGDDKTDNTKCVATCGKNCYTNIGAFC
ncbi:FDLD family class I lanthipeptide [Paenibacillus sp. NRS-1782]|uniref:FDLD family class I lanthipeptide n=1 Tax=unclassified Paenibacillus TaxID=185978 RepID=UPI003D297193